MHTFAALKAKEPAELLIRLGKGDAAVMTELYEKTRASVYAVALSVLRNPHDAEDALQETYLKLLTEAGSYKPTGSALAWILTVTRNVCISHRRKHIRMVPTADEDLEAYYAECPTVTSDDRQVLATALRCLSDEEAQIIMLHSTGGMKHREIAEIVKLPLSTVLSKYNRGLKKLKLYMEDAR